MKKLLLLILVPLNCIAQQPIQYVDPLVGTAPATTESARKNSEASSELKGQTFPAVGRPFGMTQWTPETRITEIKCIAPYYYNDKYITGFRGSHWMSGSCTQDYGSVTLMPFSTGNPDTLTVAPVTRLNHKNETSTPAYYKLQLDSYGILAELTGSVRSGMMRFTYPGKNGSYLFIRVNSDRKSGKIWIDPQKNEIALSNPVYRIYQGSGQSAGFCGYFIIKFDKSFVPVKQLENIQQIALSFGNEKIVNVRIGTSFTSLEAARKNLETEIPEWDFDKLRKATEDVWNKALGKIHAGGGSDDDMKKFYTALYHCYQLPRIASDADGSYVGFAGDSLIHKTEGFDYYDDFSMWDTFRALHPLLTILEPERTLHMVKSLILKAEQGGWMPIFPAWSSYTAAMIGDHASEMISEAYLKGIKKFNIDTAYYYIRKNAFDLPAIEDYKDGKGRRALASYLKYGYIPLEDSVWDAFHRREQVSRTLEYAYDDYSIAQIAKALGKKDDYDILMSRSQNWQKVFDTQTGFVRGRHADGRWIEPFNPFSKASFICEGTPFQYTWYVPHDIQGLINMMGGEKPFNSKLDTFFKDGHYWHGNEPDHQAAYLFAMAGQPGKTQEWVKRIIDEEYGTGPGGLSGNEDAGQMSAWLVFSMMGFYPVCPVSNQYIITTPSFDEIKINLQGNNYFLVSKVSSKPGSKYIRVITRNGGVYPHWYLTHEDIVKGSRFTLQMTDNPLLVK